MTMKFVLADKSQLDKYAVKEDTILEGIPVTPTPDDADDSKQIANTEFVQNLVEGMVYVDETSSGEVADILPLDADTLQGHPAEDFMLKGDVVVNGGGNGNVYVEPENTNSTMIIDVLKYKDEYGSEYTLYPKTLVESITNTKGEDFESIVCDAVADTYVDKTYVAEQIANCSHLVREIVTEIPTADKAKDNVIYMYKVETATGSDVYQEYQLIGGEVVLVGDTSVDLSDYVQNEELDNYFKNTGGNVNGNITVKNQDSGMTVIEIANDDGTSIGRLVANENTVGFTNEITGSWVFTSTSDGDNSFRGTSYNSSQLGGESAEVWQNKIDRTYSVMRLAFLNTPGWYRVAEIKMFERQGIFGSFTLNVDLLIRRGYFANEPESHYIRYSNTYTKSEFISLHDSVSGNNQLFTKVRYVCTEDTDNDNMYTGYLEVYYTGTYDNPCNFILNDTSVMNALWKSIAPVITEETVDGVTVVTTYDIPANVKPVQDREIYNTITWNQLTPDNCLSSQYYVDSFVNGVHNLTLVNPDITWARIQLANNVLGHKVYVRILANDELGKAIEYTEEDGESVNILTKYEGQSRVIITPEKYNYISFQFNSYWWTHTSASLIITAFDLTLMFGAGNEPTMDEFDRMFPDDYYEYNTGIELSTTRAQAVKLNEYIGKNYLPIDGSKPITGDIFKWMGGYSALTGTNVHSAIVSCENTDNMNDCTALVVYNNNAVGSYQNSLIFQIKKDGVDTYNFVLHTGNKPSGSYTGTGAARTISIGGIGNAILITGYNASNQNTCVIITETGVFGSYNNTVSSNGYSTFIDGVLTINTDDGSINGSGITYKYQVL